MRIHVKEFPAMMKAAITDIGWGCGYVILDEEHPWFGMDYNDIPVTIHGGLTYGEYISQRTIKEWDTELREDDIGKYMIGFDTGHSGDNEVKWNKEGVANEAGELLKQCISKQIGQHYTDG